MPDQKTVLILGAGASAPYGFPTGQALIDWICGEFVGVAGGLGVGEVEVKQFVSRLRRSGANSIDLFLEHNPDLQRTGKIAIAYAIALVLISAYVFVATGRMISIPGA